MVIWFFTLGEASSSSLPKRGQWQWNLSCSVRTRIQTCWHRNWWVGSIHDEIQCLWLLSIMMMSRWSLQSFHCPSIRLIKEMNERNRIPRYECFPIYEAMGHTLALSFPCPFGLALAGGLENEIPSMMKAMSRLCATFRRHWILKPSNMIFVNLNLRE